MESTESVGVAHRECMEEARKPLGQAETEAMGGAVDAATGRNHGRHRRAWQAAGRRGRGGVHSGSGKAHSAPVWRVPWPAQWPRASRPGPPGPACFPLQAGGRGGSGRRAWEGHESCMPYAPPPAFFRASAAGGPAGSVGGARHGGARHTGHGQVEGMDHGGMWHGGPRAAAEGGLLAGGLGFSPFFLSAAGRP